MNAPLFAAVALAGALGALARFGLDAFIMARTEGGAPWGTWVVNASGSLFAGLLAGYGASRGLPADFELAVTGGFLGAYTTFSTWMVQSVELAQRGAWRAAAVNVAASVLTGAAAAAGGWALAAQIAS